MVLWPQNTEIPEDVGRIAIGFLVLGKSGGGVRGSVWVNKEMSKAVISSSWGYRIALNWLGVETEEKFLIINNNKSKKCIVYSERQDFQLKSSALQSKGKIVVTNK